MGEEQPPAGGTGIKEQIKQVLTELGITGAPAAGGKPEEKPKGDGSLSGQVAEAVRIVREGDAAAREREKTEARLAALEAKSTTPATEKKPKEHRGITRLMWGGDDDDD